MSEQEKVPEIEKQKATLEKERIKSKKMAWKLFLPLILLTAIIFSAWPTTSDERIVSWLWIVVVISFVAGLFLIISMAALIFNIDVFKKPLIGKKEKRKGKLLRMRRLLNKREYDEI
ncbi:MAG: hypothetical protein AAB340_01230 [Patescibacteria group bacterium]